MPPRPLRAVACCALAATAALAACDGGTRVEGRTPEAAPTAIAPAAPHAVGVRYDGPVLAAPTAEPRPSRTIEPEPPFAQPDAVLPEETPEPPPMEGVRL